jgi:hypothetical protein
VPNNVYGGRYQQLDLLLGLDFLIKIRAIVDVEKGMIQMR